MTQQRHVRVASHCRLHHDATDRLLAEALSVVAQMKDKMNSQELIVQLHDAVCPSALRRPLTPNCRCEMLTSN